MTAVALRPTMRLPYGLLAALFLVAAIFETVQHGFSWQLPVFAIAPDLALLLGAGHGLAPAQLHPRAVPVYNALHRFVLPLALLVAVPVFDLSNGWLVAGLAWAMHVSLDRSLGYGLRTRDGFQR